MGVRHTTLAVAASLLIIGGIAALVGGFSPSRIVAPPNQEADNAPERRLINSEVATPDLESGRAGETIEEPPEDNDSTSGSETLPWETLAKVVKAHNTYRPGDEATIRRRYLGWQTGPSKTTQFPEDWYLRKKRATPSDIDSIHALIEEHDAAIERMIPVTCELLKDAFTDYYTNERFTRQRADSGQPAPEERPREGSSFWRNGYIDSGGWKCQLEFRSADYPTLEEHLSELQRMSNEREQVILEIIDSLPDM